MGCGRNGAVVSPWSVPFFCFFLLFNFLIPEKKRWGTYLLDPLHEGLVGDGCEFAIEVILMLMVDVHIEVMAGDHEVSLKKDADGVINGCAPGIQL